MKRVVKTAKDLIVKSEDPYLALLSYRSTPLENGYTPAELLMGRKLRSTLPLAPEKLTPKLWATLIFTKTRFCSHINFIGRCLQSKVFPKGFRSNFHASSFSRSNQYLYQIQCAQNSFSRNIMRITIRAMCLKRDVLDKQILQCRSEPDFYGRYIDDCIGAISSSREELNRFITSVNSFHTALKYTWEISETSLAFLDIKVSINGNGLRTSVHYKPTDSHSYLLHSSSHPSHVKNSIPYSQFLRLRRLCSDDSDFSNKSKEMCQFFEKRG